MNDQDHINAGTEMQDPPFQTTSTVSTWMAGCKCGCENEDECHGDGGCDVDVDSKVPK